MKFTENNTNSSTTSCGSGKIISNKKQVQNGSTTSGYSSSIADIKEITCDEDNNSDREMLLFPTATNSKLEEHVYDKLSYADANLLKSKTTTIKRRHSISSSNSGSSLSTTSSSSSSYFQVSQMTNDTKTNDYEEICNFQQVTSTPAKFNMSNNDEIYTYETLYNCKSSSIKRIRKINRHITIEDSFEDISHNNSTVITNDNNSTVINKYRREYSVNEIFQNLEVFKKQAKEEEKTMQKSNFKQQHNYVNDRIPRV